MTAIDPGRTRRFGSREPSTSRIAMAGRATASKAVDVGMPALAAAFLLSLAFPMFFTVAGLQLLPYRVVLLLAFVPLAMHLLSGRAGGLQLHDKLIIATVAWQCLAFLFNHGAGIIAGAGMQVVEVLGAWMLGRVAIRNASDFRMMVRILFLMVLALAPFAMVEAITKRPFLLDLLPLTGRPVWAPERYGLRRAQTVFSHPILYGVFVATSFGMVWYALQPAAGFMSRALRSAIILAALFFSLSTGAIVSFVIQAGLIGWELITRPHPKRWKIFAWLFCSFYVLVDILSNRNLFHLIVDYATFSSSTAYHRILIYRYGSDVVWANPIFGIGRNDWARPFWMGSSVDNFWLYNAMQFGLPGFLLLAAALIALMRAVIRSKLDDPTEWACRAGWLTSLGGLIVAGGTVHYWTTMLSFTMFVFAAGSWMIREPTGDGEPSRATSRRRANGGYPTAALTQRHLGAAPPQSQSQPARRGAPGIQGPNRATFGAAPLGSRSDAESPPPPGRPASAISTVAVARGSSNRRPRSGDARSTRNADRPKPPPD